MTVPSISAKTDKTARIEYNEEVKNEQFMEDAENTGNIGGEIFTDKYVQTKERMPCKILPKIQGFMLNLYLEIIAIT